jgi:alpha-glucosidase
MGAWWREAVFYQLYPRSFKDSNGDGIGDLRGVISKLDYLNDGKGGGLGIDAIWFSPFFASPQRDFGYDISDYRSIDPEYGTMDDFRELLAEAHKRGIRVLLDLVVNHSSDEHAWFAEGRSSRGSPYHGYYIWAPMRGRKKPNNWLCAFTQRSAWHPNPATGEWFLGTFTPYQPEFDWRNPNLREEVYGVMRFWLGMGADGFRLDVCTGYLKDEALRSNPFSPNLIPDLLQDHVYDRNRPEVHGILREMRKVAEEFGSAVLVGEPYGRDPALASSCLGKGDELHLAFDFHFLLTRFSAEAVKRAATALYASLPADGWPALALSNHDQPRSFFRYRSRLPGALGRKRSEARARVMAAALLFLRGSPFVYYGEELGMTNRRIARKALRDPLGLSTWPLAHIGRDGERTPMQWNATHNAGFGEGRPWLPVNPDCGRKNAEAEAEDPASLLSFYESALRARKAERALGSGALSWIDSPRGVLAFERSEGGESVLVFLNFSDRRKTIGPFPASKLVLSTFTAGETPLGGQGTALPPYGVLAVKAATRPASGKT